MGKYINPPNQTKEEWLAVNRKSYFDGVPSFDHVDDEMVLVCLFDNEIFTAALVVDNLRDYEAATDLSDKRFRTWFLVNREEAESVIS